MNKSEVLNIIKEVEPKLARDMKNNNFLGWLILSAYVQEKGGMRDLTIVISEFATRCYLLIEETYEDIFDKLESALKEVENPKNNTTFCKISLKSINIYKKYYDMIPKWFNDPNSGFDGGLHL